MADTSDPIPSLSALLRDALGDRLDPSATDLLGMVTDDVEFEFPYAPPGGTGRVEGRAALAAYLPGVARMVEIDSLTATEVHVTTDPDVTILEFFATGRGTATGVPYDQRYISVIRLRNGRIAHYRDYWNPLVAIRAAGDEAAMTAALGGGHAA